MLQTNKKMSCFPFVRSSCCSQTLKTRSVGFVVLSKVLCLPRSLELRICKALPPTVLHGVVLRCTMGHTEEKVCVMKIMLLIS